MLKMIFKIFIWFLKPTKAEKKEKHDYEKMQEQGQKP